MIVRLILTLVIFAFTLSHTETSQAQLSLLSKLGKLSTKVDSPDLKKFELPETHKGLTSKQLQANANGSWDITLDDGRRVSIEDAASQGVDLTKTALIIRSLDIPQDLNVIKKIPNDVPVYISSSRQLFELTRETNTVQLKYKNVIVPVTKHSDIYTAIYQFERTILGDKSR